MWPKNCVFCDITLVISFVSMWNHINSNSVYIYFEQKQICLKMHWECYLFHTFSFEQSLLELKLPNIFRLIWNIFPFPENQDFIQKPNLIRVLFLSRYNVHQTESLARSKLINLVTPIRVCDLSIFNEIILQVASCV